jgi:hypothetical protein
LITPDGLDNVIMPPVELKNPWLIPVHNAGSVSVTVYGAVPVNVVKRPWVGVACVEVVLTVPVDATVL